MFLSHLIVSLISLLFGFAGAAFLFKRHYRNISHRYQQYEQQLQAQREELEASKEALRDIMNQTHHEGINPIAKRIRGLCNVGFMELDRLMNFLNLLSKPHHQGYSQFAIAENLKARKCFEYIEEQAFKLETDTLNNVKKFEHLQ
jgi:hypothetical protein